MESPLSEPTIVSPRTPSKKNSGEANERMRGRTTGMEKPRKIAPITPPSAETVKAAPKARAASPRMAIG